MTKPKSPQSDHTATKDESTATVVEGNAIDLPPVPAPEPPKIPRPKSARVQLHRKGKVVEGFVWPVREDGTVTIDFPQTEIGDTVTVEFE
jgi:hypothetical protein